MNEVSSSFGGSSSRSSSAVIRAGDVDADMRCGEAPTASRRTTDLADAFGVAEIHEAVGKLLAQQTIDPTFVADEVRAFDDRGYVLGTSQDRVQPPSGPPSIANSRELWLFARGGDAWRINCVVVKFKPSSTDA